MVPFTGERRRERRLPSDGKGDQHPGISRFVHHPQQVVSLAFTLGFRSVG